MLDSLEIKKPHSLEDFQVKKIGRINLIVGKNNSGKSSVLEALRIYAGVANKGLLEKITQGHDEKCCLGDRSQMQDASSTAESNRFKKSHTALEKKQTELSEFDDKLKHYADMRISLDLDDGVKVNYGKFGGLLAEVKAITGKK